MIIEVVALLLWDRQHIEDHNIQKLTSAESEYGFFNVHDDLYVVTHLLIYISQLKCLFLFVMVK